MKQSLKMTVLCLMTAVLLTAAGPARGADPAPAQRSAHDAAGTAAHDVSHADAEPSLIAAPPAGIITAVTTLLVFALLVAVLGKYAWGPIAAGLKRREDKIRRDIADAEAARARAEATLREYNTQLANAEQRIRDMLSKAAADGEQLATGIRMKAQQEAEEIKERSQRDIESARDAAIRDIREHAADLATRVAEKILRRNINADDQRELVRNSLDELETVKA